MNLPLLVLITLILIPTLAIWTKFDLLGTTSVIKINRAESNGPANLMNRSQFGSSVADIGDLDQDGTNDIVVGAKGEGTKKSPSQGAVYILFMNATGTVKHHTRIGHLSNGGPSLFTSDQFGASVSSIGDVNNDGINDIAVGAPGYVLGAVYVLFMKRDGTASGFRAIRGKYAGKLTTNTNYSNGPPIAYNSQFGASLTSIGDFNKDGVPDIAVGETDSSNGNGKVYLLLLDHYATVLNYSVIGANIGGGPNINLFSGFASSILSLADKDGDGNIELAIGANSIGDTPQSKPNSGAIFICFLNSYGTAKSCSVMGQLSDAKRTLPFQVEQINDACGSSLASIGDINRDDIRPDSYPQLEDPPVPQIEDVITGCSQDNTGTGKGQIFVLFLTQDGRQEAYNQIPSADNTLKYLVPILGSLGLFGASLTGYQDLDKNGIREIVVGSPGDSGAGENSGAIYILFLGRGAFHPSTKLPILAIVGSAVGLFTSMLIIAFCWYFRRRKNIVEVSAIQVDHDIEAVDKNGEIIPKRRKRKIKYKEATVLVYADSYDV